MPSDTLKLQCLYCGHRQTIRVGRGLWWRCKGKPGQECGRVNPGPTIAGNVMRSAIAAGQLVVGKRPKKGPDEGAAGGGSPAPQKPAVPSAGTTVGRRAAQTVKAAGDKSAHSRPAQLPKTPAPVAPPPAKPSGSSSSGQSLGRRLLSIAKEAIV